MKKINKSERIVGRAMYDSGANSVRLLRAVIEVTGKEVIFNEIIHDSLLGLVEAGLAKQVSTRQFQLTPKGQERFSRREKGQRIYVPVAMAMRFFDDIKAERKLGLTTNAGWFETEMKKDIT